MAKIDAAIRCICIPSEKSSVFSRQDSSHWVNQKLELDSLKFQWGGLLAK